MQKQNRISLLLPLRIVLFLTISMLAMLVLSKPLDEVAVLWSVWANVVNVLTILTIVFVAKRFGTTFWKIINYQKGVTSFKTFLLVFLLIVVVGLGGMYATGFLCYGVIPYVPNMLLKPIPISKVLLTINLLALPVLTAFAEDGLYLGCGVNQIKNRYLAICIPALLYAVQHCFIPFLLDANYLAYRFLSFLPLTLILCWYYYRKRNPLPIIVGHALIDFATAVQLLATAFNPELLQKMM